TRTEQKFLFRVIERAIELGADVVNIPDTVGYSQPTEFGTLIRNIIESVPNIDSAVISVHCHNDLGLAVANSLEAIRNGAHQVEVTVNGIGERAGNAALEEVAMALFARKDYYNAYTDIKFDLIYETSKLVERLTGIQVQPNKAIVGRNAFAHESGIHQHGVLSNRATYEIIRPELVGRKTEIVIGKHSGRHAIEAILKKHNIKISELQLKKLLEIVKQKAEHKKIDEKFVLRLAHTLCTSSNKTK
ncbi:MAG: 2-isopropylmalate synthase, partial [Candidatus Diapherotrites archaeon]|nr:2-isopropylmalate synthase [Candidatus Diapherotrites archaeon]